MKSMGRIEDRQAAAEVIEPYIKSVRKEELE